MVPSAGQIPTPRTYEDRGTCEPGDFPEENFNTDQKKRAREPVKMTDGKWKLPTERRVWRDMMSLRRINKPVPPNILTIKRTTETSTYRKN